MKKNGTITGRPNFRIGAPPSEGQRPSPRMLVRKFFLLRGCMFWSRAGYALWPVQGSMWKDDCCLGQLLSAEDLCEFQRKAVQGLKDLKALHPTSSTCPYSCAVAALWCIQYLLSISGKRTSGVLLLSIQADHSIGF